MRHFIFTITFALLIASCGQSDKEKELALKEKELELKEKELKLKEDSTTVVTPISTSLTREKAKTAIIEKFKFPYTEKKEYSAFYSSDEIQQKRYSLDKLQEAGLITYVVKPWYIIVTLTDKGRQFVISESQKRLVTADYGSIFILKACEIDFLDVTGIQEIPNQNAAEVSYSVKRTVNLFGQYLFDLTNDTVTRKIVFKKFDDGWRIDQDSDKKDS
ncbi:MAG: hypothetical protein QM737_16045 [Ferruginibacter sp.]